jgi:fumarylacetoacetase
VSPTWVPTPPGTPFGLDCLPYGVFVPPGEDEPRLGVAIGEHILELPAALAAGEAAVPDIEAELVAALRAPTLDRLLAAGPPAWSAVRGWLVALLTDEQQRDRVQPALVPAAGCRLLLPFTVADYVDFYSSEHHAANVGRILRPGTEPLRPNWKHLPVGYHGRAGTVVVSGTPVVRPLGQRRQAGAEQPVFGASTQLDFEAEVGFVVGVGSPLGSRVPTEAWRDHVFGVVLVNDWSARDIQSWEYVPLGPFLAKSFATSISPWVVPLAALEPAFVDPPKQDPRPLPYLLPAGPGLALDLEVTLNGQVVSQPPFAGMYWTPAQQLAHLTVNGAALRTGDLLASGTVSGPRPDQRGSLLELTWDGQQPLTLADGSERTFLADGDTLTITGWARLAGGGRMGLGAVTATIEPAR